MTCVKKHFKIFFAIFLVIVLIGCNTLKGFALGNLWDTGWRNYIDILQNWNYDLYQFNERLLHEQFIDNRTFLNTALRFFTGDSDGVHGGGGHSRNAPTVFIDEPTINPQPIYNNKSNTVYNPVTNNYEFVEYNYIDDSVTNYNTYSFETTNNFITYEFNYTYYDVVVSPKDSPSEGKFFKVYYQLPDGRSSYNLTPDDIRGIIFNYDVINYSRTVTDSDVIGLWHLDGDFSNAVSDRETSVTNQSNLNFIDGRFGGAIGFNGGTFNNIQLDFMNADDVPSVWTLEFWVYVPEYYSTLWSPVDGSQHNYSIFPSFYSPGWTSVALDSNGDLWLNGQYSSSAPSYMFTNNPTSVLANDYMIGLGSGYYYVYFANTMRNYLKSNNGLPVYDYYFATYAVDEVKLTKRILYDGSYTPRYEPWDLNFAYTVPVLNQDYSTIAIQSPFTVNNFQIGGVRNSNPSLGDVFISVYDGVATSISQYYNGVWNPVNGAVYFKGEWVDLMRYNFNTMMLVDSDTPNTGATYIYNIYGGEVNNNVNVSGNDIFIDIDTGSANPQDVSKLLLGIPILFAFVGTVLGALCPFLPSWLTGLIALGLGCVVTLILFVFIRRK